MALLLVCAAGDGGSETGASAQGTLAPRRSAKSGRRVARAEACPAPARRAAERGAGARGRRRQRRGSEGTKRVRAARGAHLLVHGAHADDDGRLRPRLRAALAAIAARARRHGARPCRGGAALRTARSTLPASSHGHAPGAEGRPRVARSYDSAGGAHLPNECAPYRWRPLCSCCAARARRAPLRRHAARCAAARLWRSTRRCRSCKRL